VLKFLPMPPLAAVAAVLLLAACASPDPVAYGDLASSSYLKPNRGDQSDHLPFAYSSPVDWHRYAKVLVEPVAIYGGADNQLAELSSEDRADLAAYMQSQFSAALAKRFRLAEIPARDTLRIRLTLTGAATNSALLSTFAHFDLAGSLYNGVQAVRGGEGMMMGSVSYAVEICDSASNRLLEAFVAKQYPGAYNIGATFGSLAAARTGIDKGAEALAERFD
jgi:hypothetical protein